MKYLQNSNAFLSDALSKYITKKHVSQKKCYTHHMLQQTYVKA